MEIITQKWIQTFSTELLIALCFEIVFCSADMPVMLYRPTVRVYVSVIVIMNLILKNDQLRIENATFELQYTKIKFSKLQKNVFINVKIPQKN